jgi:cyclic pyranopterin phosphate synthase
MTMAASVAPGEAPLADRSATRDLVDTFGRRINYLRLSVTDRCDLRCAYCMPERMRFVPREQLLGLDELSRLAKGFIARGITKIRLTGGEPLVRRDAIALIRAIGEELGSGLEELTLTTNGTQLAAHAGALHAAGIRRINVSLDTLDRDCFRRLTRRDALADTLKGIAAAQAAGLSVKINTVALKGVNEAELPDLVSWAHSRDMEITLIEVMPLGEVEQDRYDQHLPLDRVREQLSRRWTIRSSAHRSGGPARYVDIAETGGRLGFITPLTDDFCGDCNRVRVTATGQLFGCLGGTARVDLRSALRATGEDVLNQALDMAMRIKPARHHFAIDRPGVAPPLARYMSTTGG